MAASFDPQDDRQHGHAIRRRQGGRTSIYGGAFYPASFSMNGGLAVPCKEFVPADGDPGHCANCGEYDGDHTAKAAGPYATGYQDEISQGPLGSDSATGAY